MPALIPTRHAYTDAHQELRIHYWAGGPTLIFDLVVWLGAALLGDQYYTNYAALWVVGTGMLIFPVLKLVTTLAKRPALSPAAKQLEPLFLQSALIIPFSYPVLLWLLQLQPGLFLPALSVVVGLHFLPFVYGYGLKQFWVLAGLLVLIGWFVGTNHPNWFGLTGYIVAPILALWGIALIWQVRREERALITMAS